MLYLLWNFQTKNFLTKIVLAQSWKSLIVPQSFDCGPLLLPSIKSLQQVFSAFSFWCFVRQQQQNLWCKKLNWNVKLNADVDKIVKITNCNAGFFAFAFYDFFEVAKSARIMLITFGVFFKAFCMIKTIPKFVNDFAYFWKS